MTLQSRFGSPRAGSTASPLLLSQNSSKLKLKLNKMKLEMCCVDLDGLGVLL
jgi:hypothetical protein